MIRLSILTILFSISLLAQAKQSLTMLLDPAGDVHATGRRVHDMFEHGVTMQCAQALQKKIKEYNPDMRVIISRTPGEYIENLQTANFANRLNVDCFIHISFFAQDTGYSIDLYRYTTDSTDTWNSLQLNSLTTIPLNKAHMLNQDISNNILQKLYSLATEDASLHWIKINEPIAVPYKPLLGVITPALAIEIGVPHSYSLDVLTQPLAEIICKTMEQQYDSNNKVS